MSDSFVECVKFHVAVATLSVTFNRSLALCLMGIAMFATRKFDVAQSAWECRDYVSVRKPFTVPFMSRATSGA